MAQNKVKFGLKNVHYAVATEDEDGVLTYSAPVRYPGAVSLTLDTRGETTEFYADDRVYYATTTNNGYEGTYEAAEMPVSFRTDVLGDILDADGVLTETTNAKTQKIALMFEFDGDVKATRHALYNVSVSRPGTSSSTKTETTEPTTQELSFVASPTVDGVVKRSTTAETPDEVYNAWFTTVFEPAPVVETP
ncbi:major tail protein [Solibacillus sp. FSL W7-1436]|uniref:major tail protein n=1 Tax=Solibacillus sp. FSL W7-1436 TaxID=2921705 RepID=UPI0030FA886F